MPGRLSQPLTCAVAVQPVVAKLAHLFVFSPDKDVHNVDRAKSLAGIVDGIEGQASQVGAVYGFGRVQA